MDLADCASSNPADSELLIVQANLVAYARQGRDRLTQAVLSVAPSIIKVDIAELDEVLLCSDIQWIIATLGVGVWMPGFPESYNLGALRYGKVILWTDETPEGNHLRDQLIAFFVQFQLPLLEAGRVYEVPQGWIGDAMQVSEVAERIEALKRPSTGST